MESTMSNAGLDNRHRNHDGEISHKHGNTTVHTLRKIYGQSFTKVHIGPGPETRQSASFDEVIAELTKAIYGGPIVAEVRAGEHGQPFIGAARSVAVPALEAEIDRSAGDQGKQVRIRIECSWRELDQNVHRREGVRVAHQRQ